MTVLKNKIDFAVIISVNNANPNGDPLSTNRPRVNYDGYGEISDVCIKRKIRNRLIEAGHGILIQSNDYKVDNYTSIRSRVSGEITEKDETKIREEACQKWIDVRAFGQVLAFKEKGKKKPKTKSDSGQDESNSDSESSVSIGIRGPVSIHPAFSILPIQVSSIQITKSVNGEDGVKKGSDTMGTKHRVDHGVYVFFGSINPQLATKTGFSDADAEAIQNALVKLFQNDASSARPEGSMEVVKVYWWRHNCQSGQYSSAVVHRSLKVSPKVEDPKRLFDYEISLETLPGLTAEIIQGQ